MMRVARVFLLAVLLPLALALFDIRSFGAVPNSDTLSAQTANARALLRAIQAANASSQERVVRLPAGKYYSLPVRVEGVRNLSVRIEGRLLASKNVVHWPLQPNSAYYEDFLSFWNCQDIEVSGGGKVDGRGYHWWVLCLLSPNRYLKDQNYRPHLLRFVNCNGTRIHDLVLKNSAQFHVKMDQCHDGELFNLAIRVNTTAQLNLLKRSSLEGLLPMFPFNTDGIDPSGARFHIYNISAQNWDDVVVPKPQRQADCTRDFLVENCSVALGVGMTVGSVPPEQGCNCVRNITFRNVRMLRPLKGIYVKTNPGDRGTGLIEDILYQNFTMDRPIWWAVYIGPQQMKEPDGDGPGCMLYPFDKKGTCATQPRVTLQRITLEDVRIHRSLLYPYTVRCNASNPCREINFRNVVTDQWLIGQKQNGYVCEYATGTRTNNQPPLHCLDDLDGLETNPLMKSGRSLATEKEPSRLQAFWTKQKLLTRLVSELERAAEEVGYQEDDDEFAASFSQTGIEDLVMDQ